MIQMLQVLDVEEGRGVRYCMRRVFGHGLAGQCFCGQKGSVACLAPQLNLDNLRHWTPPTQRFVLGWLLPRPFTFCPLQQSEQTQTFHFRWLASERCSGGCTRWLCSREGHSWRSNVLKVEKQHSRPYSLIGFWWRLTETVLAILAETVCSSEVNGEDSALVNALKQIGKEGEIGNRSLDAQTLLEWEPGQLCRQHWGGFEGSWSGAM